MGIDSLCLRKGLEAEALLSVESERAAFEAESYFSTDMNLPPPKKIMPIWNDGGEPVNLAAAALDSAEWLELYSRMAKLSKMKLGLESSVRMDACVSEIRKRVIF